MVGIIQEQHPDRARLFMQWKQMNWPVLVDSLNLLNVSVVPMTLAIDENGIIRKTQIPLKEAGRIEEEFVNQRYEASGGKPDGNRGMTPDMRKLRSRTKLATAESWRELANALVLWGDTRRLGEAADAYTQALKLEPGDPATHFRLGVALRKRYDSPHRHAEDFGSAVEQWSQALDLDPNNYIWRRRIQQYGPRLEKPYPFYDWVPTARQEILARGETPVALTVEPGGAEFAKPVRSFETAGAGKDNPDPQGRIIRDPGKFIGVETAVVPPAIVPGATARVHLVFRPNLSIKAHWNNEAEGLRLWIDPPGGWEVDQRYLTVANPHESVSQEAREIQFEVKCPENAASGKVRLPAYALYYVCEDVNGTCLYRRRDLMFQVQVRQPAPAR